jgi:L,D-transpeptidase ErfK/SrfK
MAKKYLGWMVAVMLTLAAYTAPVLAHAWSETAFANRPLYAYPLPAGRDDIIGTLTTYRIQKGDSLLDVGRWFGLSAKEISDANGHMDWWLPPVGRVVIMPTAHILPAGTRSGITLNVPEMRLYYYFPSQTYTRHRKGKLTATAFHAARVVYTFPVGLGRFDWKTPLGVWRVTAKIKNPTWTMPEDIYQEHLERDGEADRFVPAGPDNPLGMYKLDLSIPQYGLHGTNVPWGIGMTVSHGCVRLYPEDIERLFSKTPVGTPGEFVYQPVKFGWRGDALYAEVHDDLYGKYPGLWRLAMETAQRQDLIGKVDLTKLEKAVALKAGIPTYVGFGSAPADGTETASGATAPDSADSGADTSSSGSAPDTMAPSTMAARTAPSPMASPAEGPVSAFIRSLTGRRAEPPPTAPAEPSPMTAPGESPGMAVTTDTDSAPPSAIGARSLPRTTGTSAMSGSAFPPTMTAPASANDDDDAPDNRPSGDWQSTR